MSEQIETQNDKPKFNSEIDVGICDLRTKIEILHKNVRHIFIPTIELTLTLPAHIKGAHMSRLIESINEQIQTTTEKTFFSLEDTCKNILITLQEKHQLKGAIIQLETELSQDICTPVTKKKTTEVYDIAVTVQLHKNKFHKRLSLTAIGSSACPHALNNNPHKRTHLQRSRIQIEYLDVFDNNDVEFEKLIEIANKSFSAPVYTLVKSSDEQHIINTMYENPRFVEDICRELEFNIRENYRRGVWNIAVINEESIHRHNVIAKRIFSLNE